MGKISEHFILLFLLAFSFIAGRSCSQFDELDYLTPEERQEKERLETLFGSGHTNNWAVLVCTSRYWFNYRHVANVLSIYRSVKRLGIPDSQIVLMLSDDMACNSRNPKAATVYNNAHHHINVYGDDVEVDYRGYDVTVQNFIRILTGRLPSNVPRSKRLMSDEHSNILIYMTGHGGDGFLKFQDSEEITSVELSDAFEQMWQKRRYNEIFLMVDTCQAESMYKKLYSPNILAVASSKIGEDSLSHHGDPTIGVYVIDRYTYFALEFLEKVTVDSPKNMGQFLQVCPKRVCISTVNYRKDLFRRRPEDVLLTDFFGSVRNVELTRSKIDLQPFENFDNSTYTNYEERTEEQQLKWHYVDPFPNL